MRWVDDYRGYSEEREHAYQQHGIDRTGLHEKREPSEHPRLAVALAQMLAQQLSVLPIKTERW